LEALFVRIYFSDAENFEGCAVSRGCWKLAGSPGMLRVAWRIFYYVYGETKYQSQLNGVVFGDGSADPEDLLF